MSEAVAEGVSGSGTVSAIGNKVRAEMGEKKGKKRLMDSDDDAEQYEAWKVREIARIRKGRFDTRVASVMRQLLESLHWQQPALKRKEVARITEDTEMALLVEQLKLPQAEMNLKGAIS